MRFADITGQEKARVAFLSANKEGRVPHALILSGPEGAGKLAFARAMAQFLNCENPTEDDSCGICPSCSKIQKLIHPDVRYVFPIVSKKESDRYWTSDDYIDKFRPEVLANPYLPFKDWVAKLEADNKQLGIFIHEIRELKRKLSLKAFEAKNKIAIIWNAERINQEASNAFLKLLEEPPVNTILILTVSDPSKLIATINSRCQRLMLGRLSEAEISGWLQNSLGVPEDQAVQISQVADGSLTRAQELAGESEKSLAGLFLAWLKASITGNHELISKVVQQLAAESREFQKLFLSFSLKKFRDSMLVQAGVGRMAVVSNEERPAIEELTKRLDIQSAEKIARLLEDSAYYITRNANTQMVFTVLCIRIHSLLGRKN